LSIISGTYVVKDVEIIVKEARELFDGDIILHPIYREDGLMLINRYTQLTEGIKKQIWVHLSEDAPIGTVPNFSQFNRFLIGKVYGHENFLALLAEIIKHTEKNYTIPITILSYLDERVDYRLLNKYAVLPSREEVEPTESIIGRLVVATPLWDSFENILESPILQQRAREIKLKLIDILNNDKSILELIVKMSNYDKIFLMRSMNALCISLLLGLTMEITEEELLNLALTALFCNIGFVDLDKEIFYSSLETSVGVELVGEHIKMAVDIISKSEFCRNKAMLLGIMEHHELYNGCGYPMGKQGKAISLFGRVLSIVFEYDDLVAGSLNRMGINSNTAEDIMWNDVSGRYDRDILKIFLYRTNIFKIGRPYININREKGVIIGFSNFIEEPVKPIVKYEGYMVDYMFGHL
jgi:HD-GYP domain-containing protein (c-di-GMP phosphodiesterase class II)